MNEADVVHNWLCGNELDHGVFADVEPINIYNNWCFNYDMEDTISPVKEDTSDNFVENCTNIENWHMPETYKELDIEEYLYTKVCQELQIAPSDFVNNSSKWIRVEQELTEYQARGMYPVLQFLVYMVDVCKENNVVLGVGRGSSVASYILYLLGVHRVDSLKYDLDIKEFLK